MTAKKNAMGKKRLLYLLLRIAAAAAVLILGVSIIKTQIELKRQEKKLEDILAAVSDQQDANDEINRLIESGADLEYIEKIAREKFGYVSPDEKVYIDLAGS